MRNPENLLELPREVLSRAAQLAAWHSKARGARGKVEVHVCRVADVSKPRGFAPGEVTLRRWDSVWVYARDGEIDPEDAAQQGRSQETQSQKPREQGRPRRTRPRRHGGTE